MTLRDTPLTDKHSRDSEDCIVVETNGNGIHVAAARSIERELLTALEAKDAEIARLRDALDWYADEARACAANSGSGKHTAAESLLASVTVLALDGGKRADAARGTT